MPRYFIDTDDGRSFCFDDEGRVYADLAEVEAEALRSLSDMARDRGSAVGRGKISASVRDEGGEVLVTATLQVSVERSVDRRRAS